ncbi:hypothetical protein AURDEDRAFT_76216, partial [Auricularia subglabra TFB-10046 SS5]
MKAKQRGRPIKDFAKEIRNLAVRYPDIDEYALRRIFWNGADTYIQLFWTEKGRSLEYDDISTLLIYAQRVEKRERLKKRLGATSTSVETANPKPAIARSSGGARQARSSNWRASRATGRGGGGGKRTGGRSSSSKPVVQQATAKAATPSQPRRAGPSELRYGSKLTAQQEEEHRAQNLCFYCHKPGHLATDCYARKEARRSGAR